MVTAEHAELIRQLSLLKRRNWGQDALLACLRKLRDGGPTEYQIVEVRRARPVEDGFDIVYLSPWGPEVGLAARVGLLKHFIGIYQGSEDSLTAEAFGQEVADFYVAEPLGNYSAVLDFDESGLGWWGAGHAV